MTTSTDELTAIARELAERLHDFAPTPNGSLLRCKNCGYEGLANTYSGTPLFCNCFAALRGEHEWGYGSEGEPGDCVHCGDAFDFTEHLYCLRTDLGAIVRCAAACGFEIDAMLYDDTLEVQAGKWVVGFTGYRYYIADTPELAAIRALKAAVE